MSLYTPPSVIRRLILEAEELTLNPSPAATEVQDSTESASPMEVAADLSNAAPQATPPGLQGSTLSMPNAVAPPSTVSKTVINKDIILAQLAELKSIVTNYEKQFEGDDLTPEDGNVYISSLLSALVFHAEKLNAFMESAPAPAAPNTGVQMPQSEIEPPLPEAMPEQPLPPQEEPLGLIEPPQV